MRKARSIVFYAWAGLAVQVLLALGVIGFVLAGAAYQRSAVTKLHGRVEVLRDVNLALLADFLDTQGAAQAYQAIGEPRLLGAFSAGQNLVAADFAHVHRLAWSAVAGQVLAEQRLARAALRADTQAMNAPPGSTKAAAQYTRAAANSARFVTAAGRLRHRLALQGDVFAARSERLLGVGLGWTAAIVAIGFMLPVLAAAAGLRWASIPLHTITDSVRKRTLGDRKARSVPGGPADVRELATSLNRLADESDRLMAAEVERNRLLGEVHLASAQIHEHLRADAIIREAVTAIHEHMTVDFVWVGIVAEDRLTLAEGQSTAGSQIADIVANFAPDTVGWIRDVYLHRSSYRIQDVQAAQAEEVPAGITEIMRSRGARSMLLMPFGAGQELLGCLILLRTDHGHVWAQPEIEAVEALAGDIGRALEHARLYEGEQRLVAELKALDQAKSSFIASASHDLRTPLTSIIGYVELLSEDAGGLISPDQAGMLDGVDRNARRLQAMVEDMLTTSKIELGNFMTRLRRLDLTDMVPASASVISPAATKAGLAFELRCPDHPVLVNGDPEQLDRLLTNLLSNAVKYTPRGGTVTLSLDIAGESAVLKVADSGIGIPEQDQGSLSTRFFRASNAVEAAIPGSGLGLSIVSAIVDNHHGDLSIESAQDRGTTVTVRIPLYREATGPATGGELGVAGARR